MRAAAVGALGLCFRLVGDGFLVMLFEALNFPSELLEDPHGAGWSAPPGPSSRTW